MQAAMDRLGSLISRRRKVVLGIWIALLVISLPFFAMQSKHLTAGGFEVPDSQSTFVANSINLLTWRRIGTKDGNDVISGESF